MREIDCLFDLAEAEQSGRSVHRLHAVRPDGLPKLLGALAPGQRDYLTFTGFAAKAANIAILPPAPDGLMDAVLGLGADDSHAPFGALPFGLPSDTFWRLASCDIDPNLAVLGFGLGAYRFTELKACQPSPARLMRVEGTTGTIDCLRAIWLGRDLINRPANLLGPAELAEAVLAVSKRYSATAKMISGPSLEEAYPAIAAVGRGSDRAPSVVILHWQGSHASAKSPLISLCGKGVCFDSGGYDLKPSAGMLRMKKDMGGAAAMLALAAMIMAADLPIRIALRIGCVENSVSGAAMRPLDVIRTRSGRTVEIGNTDAEGRLVLCDLLDEAAAEGPELLIDAATLTGAARTALGPDLPALFCNDPSWSARVIEAGNSIHDPMWPLPLWSGYNHWLDSAIADLNNVSTKTFAGAIVAALFLQRFVASSQTWIHIDLYAWNDQSRPSAPEGGEIQAARALFLALRRQYENVGTTRV